jgi:pSer/pThr/pTyr-binding forkhead associated (FHA) protein
VSKTAAQVAHDPLTVAPDAPRTLTGFLVSYEANELGAFWPLYQGKNVVGRKAAMDGLDVEIDHPTTSSRHAVIHAAARPGALKLEDPGSTNGTYLNEERVAKGAPVELRDGDALRFGGFTTTVKIV